MFKIKKSFFTTNESGIQLINVPFASRREAKTNETRRERRARYRRGRKAREAYQKLMVDLEINRNQGARLDLMDPEEDEADNEDYGAPEAETFFDHHDRNDGDDYGSSGAAATVC